MRPSAIEQRVGEIAGLAHNRAECDALQRLGLLADDADQVAPEDFKLDAIHHAHPLTRHDAAGVVDRRMPVGEDDRSWSRVPR